MVRMYTIFWGDERANVHPFTGYSDVKIHILFFSRLTPLWTLQAILLALLQRHQTGEGAPQGTVILCVLNLRPQGWRSFAFSTSVFREEIANQSALSR